MIFSKSKLRRNKNILTNSESLKAFACLIIVSNILLKTERIGIGAQFFISGLKPSLSKGVTRVILSLSG